MVNNKIGKNVIFLLPEVDQSRSWREYRP